MIQSLVHRDWPGNVRELENCIARYVILGTEEVFQASELRKSLSTFNYEATEDGKIPLKRIAQQVSRRMEHDVILKVLQANHWNRRKTAEILKISYRALLYKVRQAGLPAKRPQRKVEAPPEYSVGSQPKPISSVDAYREFSSLTSASTPPDSSGVLGLTINAV